MKIAVITRNILAVIIIATIIKYWVNILSDNGLQWNSPSQSIVESKNGGSFVSVVKATPNKFEWRGSPVAFKEVWMEKEAKIRYSYIWFSRQEGSGNYILCLNLAQGREIINTSGAFFVVDGVADQSFATVGSNELFFSEINSAVYLSHSLRVRLTPSLTDASGQVIQLTW